jgi:hypothetical protein
VTNVVDIVKKETGIFNTPVSSAFIITN